MTIATRIALAMLGAGLIGAACGSILGYLAGRRDTTP